MRLNHLFHFSFLTLTAGLILGQPAIVLAQDPYQSDPSLNNPYSDPYASPETEPTPTEQPNSQVCQVSYTSTFAVASMTSDLLQATSWLTFPEKGLEKIFEQFGPSFAALTQPAPWPELNDRARQAKVPVIMYHDVLPKKEVFFDVTIAELEADFQFIQKNGMTPISLDQLVSHLRTGLPLPEKPVVLTFDDGYVGHYTHVFPLLKKYGYPAVFSIFTAKPDGKIVGRSTVSWEQIREMAADPLVTIAAHSVTHPPNLTELDEASLRREVTESKRLLEERLGFSIRYFTYPEGWYNEKVTKVVTEAGYKAALTMSDAKEIFAGQSESLLAIGRYGQSRLEEILPQAWGGPTLPKISANFDFASPIQQTDVTIHDIPLRLISGGRPITIHAKSRYQVPEIIAGTEAIAAVDGGFFSLEFLDSNVMIGPVMSQNTKRFIPGSAWDKTKIGGRPLVVIGPTAVRFIPFDPNKHNLLEGIQAEMPDVTDTFVAAARLVKDSQPQPAETFGDLFDFNEPRHRAFWGITQGGQPKIGVTVEPVGSVELGVILAKAGFRDAVMLDSGASTSLAFKNESLVGYTPRPVPHVVALVPPNAAQAQAPGCVVATSPKP